MEKHLIFRYKINKTGRKKECRTLHAPDGSIQSVRLKCRSRAKKIEILSFADFNFFIFLSKYYNFIIASLCFFTALLFCHIYFSMQRNIVHHPINICRSKSYAPM